MGVKYFFEDFPLILKTTRFDIMVGGRGGIILYETVLETFLFYTSCLITQPQIYFGQVLFLHFKTIEDTFLVKLKKNPYIFRGKVDDLRAIWLLFLAYLNSILQVFLSLFHVLMFRNILPHKCIYSLQKGKFVKL